MQSDEKDDPQIILPPPGVVYVEGAEDPEEFIKKLVAEETIIRGKLSLPTQHLSVSQVRAYQRCPRQYYFKYIERLPGKRISSSLVEGRALHKALETVLKGKQSNDDIPADTLDDVFREAWKADVKDVDVVYEESEDENLIQRRSGQFIRKYKSDHLPRIEPLGVEKKFVVPLTEFDIPVVGYIDLIDGGEEDKVESVVDHKVLGRTRSQAEIDNDMQMTLYSHVTGTPKVRLDMFIKNKTPVIKTIRSLRQASNIRWVEHVFSEVAQAISKGVFPPCDPMSFHCRKDSCDFYAICRE